jgi:hypothetical protein
MRQMYIILSIAGWAWLGVLAIVMAARRWQLQREQARGFPVEPIVGNEPNPQAVERP